MLFKNGAERWPPIRTAVTAAAFKVLPRQFHVDNTLNSFYQHTGFRLKEETSKMLYLEQSYVFC